MGLNFLILRNLENFFNFSDFQLSVCHISHFFKFLLFLVANKAISRLVLAIVAIFIRMIFCLQGKRLKSFSNDYILV